MGHAEDGSIEFAALALTEESTDKLSEERQSIRANNDVEGWHRRLNSKASSAGNLNLYLMLQLLAEESRLVTRGCQLLKESTIIRRQRADARSTNAKLFRIWDSLVTRERTARQVLRAVSHLVPF
ncbi:hypothetical protein ACOMHN_019479 [Nucella lapillus]